MASRLILAVGIEDDDQPPEALNIIISSTMTPARVSYTRKYSSSASYPPSIFSALLVPLQTNYVLLIEFRVRNGFPYSTASFGLHLCPPPFTAKSSKLLSGTNGETEPTMNWSLWSVGRQPSTTIQMNALALMVVRRRKGEGETMTPATPDGIDFE